MFFKMQKKHGNEKKESSLDFKEEKREEIELIN